MVREKWIIHVKWGNTLLLHYTYSYVTKSVKFNVMLSKFRILIHVSYYIVSANQQVVSIVMLDVYLYKWLINECNCLFFPFNYRTLTFWLRTLILKEIEIFLLIELVLWTFLLPALPVSYKMDKLLSTLVYSGLFLISNGRPRTTPYVLDFRYFVKNSLIFHIFLTCLLMQWVFVFNRGNKS